MSYDTSNIGVKEFIVEFLNTFEELQARGPSDDINYIPLEVSAVKGPMSKFVGEFVLSADNCKDWRIRKRLKANNGVVYRIACRYKLTVGGKLTIWPDSIEFLEYDVRGKRPALKKLQKLISKHVVEGYKIVARRINFSTRSRS